MAEEQEKQIKVVKKKKKKQQKTFYKVLGIIADIIIYPVIIISLLASFGMLISKRANQLPSVFGVSVVKIMSPSMVTAGFEVGDIVFIKKTNISKLKVGDVVAFYKYIDNQDRQYYDEFVTVEEYKTKYNNTSLGETISGRTPVEKIQRKNAIYFHRIKNIRVLPKDGSLFFETAGSASDQYSDGYIRSDYVVGEYIKTPNFVRDTLEFCSSRWGMILLIVLPLSILVLLECLSIVDQINEMIIENKVFYREEPYDSEESIKAHIGREMELHKQIYFWATTKDEQKEDVKNFLWGHLQEEELTKEELELKQLVDKSIEIYNTNQNQYYDYWLGNMKSNYQKRKLNRLIEQHKVEEIIKNKKV